VSFSKYVNALYGLSKNNTAFKKFTLQKFWPSCQGFTNTVYLYLPGGILGDYTKGRKGFYDKDSDKICEFAKNFDIMFPSSEKNQTKKNKAYNYLHKNFRKYFTSMLTKDYVMMRSKITENLPYCNKSVNGQPYYKSDFGLHENICNGHGCDLICDYNNKLIEQLDELFFPPKFSIFKTHGAKQTYGCSKNNFNECTLELEALWNKHNYAKKYLKCVSIKSETAPLYETKQIFDIDLKLEKYMRNYLNSSIMKNYIKPWAVFLCLLGLYLIVLHDLILIKAKVIYRWVKSFLIDNE